MQPAKPVFRDCLFDGNAVTDNNGQGGAIFQQSQNANLIVERCRFLNNSAGNAGGAIYSSYGGGQTLPTAWTIIKNSLIAGNTASVYGAALAIEGQDSYVLMEHCTITDNTSTWESVKMTNVFIYNSIIWNNSLDGEGLAIAGLSGDTEMQNSLIENGPLLPNFDATTGLTMDPVFSDTASGDYTLSLASFALGAGATQYYNPQSQSVVTIGGTDLAGNARIQPTGSNPDLGAYEAQWAETPYPDAPSNLTAEPLHHGVQLNWNFPNADDVARYFIYQSADSVSWTPVDTVTGRLVTRTTLSGLTNGTIYYYYVSAQDTADYESQPSNGVSVVPKYQGPVWYVDDDGPIFGGEGSPESPFDNIGDAIEISADGDTVLILPGTYDSFNDRNLNLQDVPIGAPPLPYVRNLVIIGSEGPDSTLIDLGNSGSFLAIDHGETATELVGLTIQNGINTALQVGSNQTLIHTEVTVRNCRFINNSGNDGGAINLDTGSNLWIYDCVFDGNTATNRGGAIHSWGADFFVQNSIFYLNESPAGGALYLDNNAQTSNSCEIVQSLFLENNGSYNDGFGVAIVAAPIYIYNTIFFGNLSGEGTDHEMWHGAGTPVVVDHCILQSETQVFGNGENWIFDPLIADPDNGDFSLSEYSPAIGRGRSTYPNLFLNMDVSVPVTDFYGNSRPQPEGSLPDLGPIEHERGVQRYFVYSVATDGNDITNDGLSAPFQTIQRALNEVNEFDTVEVAAGTYAGVGNTQLDFGGVKSVLRSAEGPAATVIDCEDNSFGLEFSSGESPEVLVQGFTIKRGATPEGGSAIRILNSSPTLRDLVLVNNTTGGTGSAVAVDSGDPRFINCILFQNTGNGGAVHSLNGNPVFEHCTILNNSGSDGSGAFVVDGGSLTVLNSILWGNTLTGEEITDIPGTSAIDVSHSIVMGDYPGTAVFNGRPALVSPPTGDFSPEDYSPVIGMADTSDFIPEDIFGNARTVSDSTAPDVGAVESSLARPDTSGYTPLTFWVDINGSDTGSGLSPADAFGTLQRAVNFALWNDTVKVLPGHFTQDFTTSRKDIAIIGAGPVPMARISGTGYLQGGSPALANLAFRGTNVALEMVNTAPDLSFLEFSNNNGSPGLFILQNSAPRFDHVTIADNTGNLYEASDSSMIFVTNSIIFNTGGGTDADGTTTYDITWSLTGSSGTGNVDLDPEFRSNSYRLL
ncbi:MAG: right-handed parallel beta-helix repeat-containing protein, partial [Fidelibacterota bacterium]